MKSIDRIADESLLDSSKEILSDRDEQRFKKEILSVSGALSCFVAGYLYRWLFPEQEVVRALIYLLGIVIIGTPVLMTAIRGFLARDMEAAMEILVTIAMTMSALNGQFDLAILIPVVLTFTHFLEEKSIMGGRDAIKGLRKMQADTAILLKDGKETEISAPDLKLDDIIMIRPGMSLPVDGTVVFGVSSIDQQSLTGESVPKTVVPGDPVFAGTFNIDGSVQVRVTKEYADSSFRKILKLLEDAENISIPETRIIDGFMLYYIPLTLIVALLVWLFSQDITRAIAVLVVSCPCGLMLISSAPMIAALSNAAGKGILIKNSAFIEHLAETDYVIFDKTGTVTKGTLEAESYHTQAADFDELVTTAACVAYASLHPISKSILALCEGREFEKGFEVKEHIGRGLTGKKGDDVVHLGSYSWVRSLGFEVPDRYEDAGSCDWIVKNGKVLGCIVFRDTPREDAKQVMSELKAIGVSKTCLLTGDRFAPAENIRSEVGIDEMQCELLPEQKLAHVEQRMQDHVVSVVGDGINDALALSRAHVGIAMAAMGSDTAIQSADVALMNNNLANIPYAIRLARTTKGIIYQNIVLAFSISVVMAFMAGAGIVAPLPGAFFHSIGAFVVLLNSGRVLAGDIA